MPPQNHSLSDNRTRIKILTILWPSKHSLKKSQINSVVVLTMLNTTTIYPILWYWSDIKGAFHSNKTSENFETGTNGAEIFWEGFQKIQKLLNFRKANYSTKNIGNSGRKAKWNGISVENFSIPRKVVLFSWNSKTAVSFVAGNFPREI